MRQFWLAFDVELQVDWRSGVPFEAPAGRSTHRPLAAPITEKEPSALPRNDQTRAESGEQVPWTRPVPDVAEPPLGIRHRPVSLETICQFDPTCRKFQR